MTAQSPIDIRHLRSQAMGDTDLESELLDLFARQAERIVTELAATNGAAPEVRRRRADLLHLLCGSARAVGAWGVAASAEHLEREERKDLFAAEAGSWRTERLAALDRHVACARNAIAVLRRSSDLAP